MKKYPLNMKDIEFTAFRRSQGNGGQHANKTSTAIRATHIPTNTKVETSTERSQTANKKRAVELLQEKLDEKLNNKLLEVQKETHNAKPEASFGSQIRTYRMCGNTQNVVDHRTGIMHPDTKTVLRGDIDRFLVNYVEIKKSYSLELYRLWLI